MCIFGFSLCHYEDGTSVNGPNKHKVLVRAVLEVPSMYAVV